MKRLAYGFLAAGFIIYGCSGSKEAEKETNAAAEYKYLTTEKVEAICADIDNSLECAKAVENAQIKKYSASVKRNGPILSLSAEKGSPIVFNDTEDTFYSFVDYFQSIGYYVVLTHSFESYNYKLVNAKTKKSFSVNGLPVLSPDNKRIAAASLDLEAGYMPNSFQIWKVDGDRLAMEYSIEPKEWGPSKPVWLTSTSLKFNINTLQEDYSVTATEAKLVKSGDYWTIKK